METNAQGQTPPRGVQQRFVLCSTAGVN